MHIRTEHFVADERLFLLTVPIEELGGTCVTSNPYCRCLDFLESGAFGELFLGFSFDLFVADLGW